MKDKLLIYIYISSFYLNFVSNFLGRESIKIRGNIQLQLHLDSLENISSTKGLTPEHIIDLVDVIGSCKHSMYHFSVVQSYIGS